MDWNAAKQHFDTVRDRYKELVGMPGVNTSLALAVTFQPLLRGQEAALIKVELHIANLDEIEQRRRG
jgi:hypothetical protein